MCVAYLLSRHEAHAAGVPGAEALDAGQVERLCKAVDMLKEGVGSKMWVSASPLAHLSALAVPSGACILCTVK